MHPSTLKQKKTAGSLEGIACFYHHKAASTITTEAIVSFYITIKLAWGYCWVRRMAGFFFFFACFVLKCSDTMGAKKVFQRAVQYQENIRNLPDFLKS